MTAGGFHVLARRLIDLAETHCDGRVVVCLEGGYDLEGLVEGTAACLDVLRDRPAVAPRGATAAVDRLRAAHREHWDCLA